MCTYFAELVQCVLEWMSSKRFPTFAVFIARASLQCKGRGQGLQKPQLFSSTCQTSTAWSPTAARSLCMQSVCTCRSACVSANMYVSHLALPLSGTSTCRDLFAFGECTCWIKALITMGSIHFLKISASIQSSLNTMDCTSLKVMPYACTID